MEIPVPQGIFWSRNFWSNWKPAERHGYVFPCPFIYSDGSRSLETWQCGILYCCNLPSLSFSLLPLNLGSEVFRRTLLGVSVLFCGCTIMELVKITCLRILKINLLHGHGFYLSHTTFHGTTCCRYYPFYVAPFVSDLKGLSRFQISFDVDKPLRPFDQLMAVLPSQRHIHHSYCCHLF